MTISVVSASTVPSCRDAPNTTNFTFLIFRVVYFKFCRLTLASWIGYCQSHQRTTKKNAVVPADADAFTCRRWLPKLCMYLSSFFVLIELAAFVAAGAFVFRNIYHVVLLLLVLPLVSRSNPPRTLSCVASRYIPWTFHVLMAHFPQSHPIVCLLLRHAPVFLFHQHPMPHIPVHVPGSFSLCNSSRIRSHAALSYKLTNICCLLSCLESFSFLVLVPFPFFQQILLCSLLACGFKCECECECAMQ